MKLTLPEIRNHLKKIQLNAPIGGELNQSTLGLKIRGPELQDVHTILEDVEPEARAKVLGLFTIFPKHDALAQMIVEESDLFKEFPHHMERVAIAVLGPDYDGSHTAPTLDYGQPPEGEL